MKVASCLSACLPACLLAFYSSRDWSSQSSSWYFVLQILDWKQVHWLHPIEPVSKLSPPEIIKIRFQSISFRSRLSGHFFPSFHCHPRCVVGTFNGVARCRLLHACMHARAFLAAVRNFLPLFSFLIPAAIKRGRRWMAELPELSQLSSSRRLLFQTRQAAMTRFFLYPQNIWIEMAENSFKSKPFPIKEYTVSFGALFLFEL